MSETSFEALFAACSQHGILLSPQRAKRLHELAALDVVGEFWECGVYKGASARLIIDGMAKAVRARATPFRLFDTFEGLPEPRAEDAFAHFKGEFRGSIQEVHGFLRAFPFLSYHPGLIPETFAPYRDAQIAFCHCDLDQYQSTLDALSFIWPRMVRGGLLVLDDYGREPGVERAVRELGISVRDPLDLQVIAVKE